MPARHPGRIVTISADGCHDCAARGLAYVGARSRARATLISPTTTAVAAIQAAFDAEHHVAAAAATTRP